MTSVAAPSHAAVADILARHLPLYRRHAPHYQTVMLGALAALWHGPHRRLIDVGGGTGVIGAAMQALLPVEAVEAIDVEDRFLPGLAIATRIYDGSAIPAADGHYDAATLNNVLHHVPRTARLALLREICRVTGGPLYIKDHLRRGALDGARLALLDLMGNLPFSGMVEAQYLSQTEWDSLAADAGYRIAEVRADRYRSGVLAALFPNRLEIAMRWEPLACKRRPGPTLNCAG